MSDTIYNKIRKDLIMVVQATTRELEYILKTKVNPKKFSNYERPHSPYWQFLFQKVEKGTRISSSNQIVEDNSILIVSETFPEGRDKNTKDQGNQVRVSIRSGKPKGMNETSFQKEAFVGVIPVSEGEFVVPFSIMSSKTASLDNNRQNVLLTLSINNASFLVDGKKTSTYQMTTNEIYIAGKNANGIINGIGVLRIADNHIMNPQLHILYYEGTITINARGDVNCRSRRIGSNGVVITKGSTILINKTIQIEIK